MTAQYKYTADLDDAFFTRLREVAREVGAEPLDMLSVMMSESGVSASATNPNGHATGLIQFMPATLAALRYNGTWQDFRHLTATQQLEWVERYYKPWTAKAGGWSVASLYQATFLPATLGNSDPGHVIAARQGTFGWAYDANAVFDANKDGAIQVSELTAAVQRNCKGPRWEEIKARLEGKPAAEVDEVDEKSAGIDLRTTRGLQMALDELGFEPGPIDGIPGKKTRRALIAFQGAADLKADGILGPITRKALAHALAAPGTVHASADELDVEARDEAADTGEHEAQS